MDAQGFYNYLLLIFKFMNIVQSSGENVLPSLFHILIGKKTNTNNTGCCSYQGHDLSTIYFSDILSLYKKTTQPYLTICLHICIITDTF